MEGQSKHVACTSRAAVSKRSCADGPSAANNPAFWRIVPLIRLMSSPILDYHQSSAPNYSVEVWFMAGSLICGTVLNLLSVYVFRCVDLRLGSFLPLLAGLLIWTSVTGFACVVLLLILRRHKRTGRTFAAPIALGALYPVPVFLAEWLAVASLHSIPILVWVFLYPMAFGLLWRARQKTT